MFKFHSPSVQLYNPPTPPPKHASLGMDIDAAEEEPVELEAGFNGITTPGSVITSSTQFMR